MSASDPQPSARPGLLRRTLSADGAVLTVLVLGITAGIALGGYAVTGYFELSAETRQIHTRMDALGAGLNARIDETNARIDETNARIDETNARIDETNARIDALNADMNARFDRLFALLDGTLQDYARRLDAIERQLADRPAPPGSPVTP